MESLAHFFPDNTVAPPQLVQEPQDAGLVQRVNKLVQFATRNGPSFVELIKKKQKDNPEYGFLTDGDGSDFYRYTLFTALSAAADLAQQTQQPDPVTPQQPQIQVAPAQGYLPQHQEQQQHAGMDQPFYQAALPESSTALPADVVTNWNTVLYQLTGSKESIKSAAAWFLTAPHMAGGLSAQMVAHAEGLQEYKSRLHVLYLANDILLKALDQRPKESKGEPDIVALGMRPVVPALLAATCTAGNLADEVKTRLLQIVHFWRDKKVFDPEATMQQEKAVEMGQAPPSQQQQQQQYQQQQIPQQQMSQQQMPQQQMPQQFPPPLAGGAEWPAFQQQHLQQGYHDPSQQQHWQQHQRQAQWPQHQHQQFPPQQWPNGGVNMPLGGPGPGFNQGQPGYDHPAGYGYGASQQEPFAPSTPPLPNPTSFPPGLLPQLVAHGRGEVGAYDPITQEDIASTGMPAPQEPDAYLRSRLDQFYAELQDYRPGISRADVEDSQRKTRRAEGRTEELPAPQREHAKTWGDPSSSSKPSSGGGGGGGRSGKGGSGRVGLGFDEPADEPSPAATDGYGSAYDSFRQARSGKYYSTISRNVALRNVAKGEVMYGDPTGGMKRT